MSSVIKSRGPCRFEKTSRCTYGDCHFDHIVPKEQCIHESSIGGCQYGDCNYKHNKPKDRCIDGCKDPECNRKHPKPKPKVLKLNGPKPCNYGSTCTFGDKCKYDHSLAPPKVPCKFRDTCTFGDKCKYDHTVPECDFVLTMQNLRL